MDKLYIDVDNLLVHLIASGEYDEEYLAELVERAKKLKGEPLKKRFLFIPDGRKGFINGFVATDRGDQRPLYDKKDHYMRFNLRNQKASHTDGPTERQNQTPTGSSDE